MSTPLAVVVELTEYWAKDGFTQSHEQTIDSMSLELGSPNRLRGIQR